MSARLVDLEADSVAYIREQLESARGLGQLLARLDLESGRVQAFVPEDLPAAASGYRTGALRGKAQEAEVLAVLAEYLIESRGLTSRADLALIAQFAEGARLPPDDERSDGGGPSQYRTVWLVGAQPEYYNGELWVIDSEVEAHVVQGLLQELLWFPAVAVLTEVNDRFSDNDKVELEPLWDIVRDPEAVLVGGWDAMNYLLWTPE